MYNLNKKSAQILFIIFFGKLLTLHKRCDILYSRTKKKLKQQQAEPNWRSKLHLRLEENLPCSPEK